MIVLFLQEFMPINWMRQVAVNQTRTRFVALFDVDLVPSLSLYDNLLKLRKNYTNVKRVRDILRFTFHTVLHRSNGNRQHSAIVNRDRNTKVQYNEILLLFQHLMPNHNSVQYT